MRSVQYLTQAEWNALLRYDPATGDLFWKGRQAPGRSSAERLAGFDEKEGYRALQVNGIRYMAHRVIWIMVHGYEPHLIDHVNLVRKDNRIANLRNCTDSQNQCNRRPIKGKKYKGITYSKAVGKYLASIRINRVATHLGCFETEEDAARAYDVAAMKAHGDFAWLNFPQEERA